MEYEILMKNIDKDLELVKSIPPPTVSTHWAREIQALEKVQKLLHPLKKIENELVRVKVMDRAMDKDSETAEPNGVIAKLEQARAHLKEELSSTLGQTRIVNQVLLIKRIGEVEKEIQDLEPCWNFDLVLAMQELGNARSEAESQLFNMEVGAISEAFGNFQLKTYGDWRMHSNNVHVKPTKETTSITTTTIGDVHMQKREPLVT